MLSFRAEQSIRAAVDRDSWETADITVRRVTHDSAVPAPGGMLRRDVTQSGGVAPVTGAPKLTVRPCHAYKQHSSEREPLACATH